MSTKVGKMVPPRQRRWMQAIQKRVGVTTEAIGSIKGIKMTGLTDKISEQIQSLREFEMDESKRFRRVQIMNILLGSSPCPSPKARGRALLRPNRPVPQHYDTGGDIRSVRDRSEDQRQQ